MYEEHDLLTVKELADILRVDAGTVKRYLQTGKIKAFKTPGGQWRIYRYGVEYLLKRGGDDDPK